MARLDVRPKVDKVQTHRLTRDTLKAAEAYVTQDANEKGPLFKGSRKGGELQGGMVVRSITIRVGYIGNRKTTHNLRHSAITNAIRDGAQPLQVQAMARHRSFYTTLSNYHELGRIASPAEDLIDYSIDFR